MSHVIIKQPSGKYCVWSTIVDDFILIDATPSDILEMDVSDYRRSREREILRQVKEFDAGVVPWISIEEAIETVKDIHGKRQAALRRRLLSPEQKSASKP